MNLKKIDEIAQIAIANRFTELAASLSLESDRGSVLVIAALLERTIETQLETRLLPKIKKDDELIGRSSNQSISNFSAKINLAYRVGIISSIERTIYHQLRDLRNLCAHEIGVQTFKQVRFVSKTKEIISKSFLVWSAIALLIYPQIKHLNYKEQIETMLSQLGIRKAFEIYFSMIIAQKEYYALEIPKISPLYEAAYGFG